MKPHHVSSTIMMCKAIFCSTLPGSRSKKKFFRVPQFATDYM